MYWAGGEALIMKEHYMVLERIIEMGYAKDIEVRYNSNGLEWDSNLFDLWKEYKNVIFHFGVVNSLRAEKTSKFFRLRRNKGGQLGRVS